MPQSLALFLAVCVVAGLGATAETAGIWLDVPFVKQEQSGCGAACISMVMRYWSRNGGAVASASADAARIQRALYSGGAEGIGAADMERYLQDEGFRTFAFKGAWADLKQHLSKGRPLIVSLRNNGRGAAFHCVVVAGLDWQRDLIMMNDPARRKLLQLDRPTFERAWSGAGHWTILALPNQSR